MGWDFILKAFALSAGVQLMEFLFDVFQAPGAVTEPIEAGYLIVMLVFIGTSAVSAFKVLAGRGRAVR
ncbi:MAG TPA: hypothetical protein VJ989_00350 [Solirubrobacterales bacterium]|jgi:hypothetical protein|nr:hypothetical protein [Solirubrobacterales bacterium]